MSEITVTGDLGCDSHLPDFASKEHSYGMLGSGLRHLGIMVDGEIVCTVWNHHNSQSAIELADAIVSALTARDAEGRE